MGSDFASVPIVDHLRDIAEQYPDKLAVSDGVDRLNYSDLFSAVENLSRRIATTSPTERRSGFSRQFDLVPGGDPGEHGRRAAFGSVQY